MEQVTLNKSVPDHQAQENSRQFELEQTGNSQSEFDGSDIAISVRNISKKYQLYETPIHRLKEAIHPFKKKYHREFWALKNISFNIPRGTTFGIIGRNGSGKSTLLQIINGILKPTTGIVRIKGRITALLELGAGFNRDFTGSENIFMQGAIMGIARKEMAKRFDRITEFAEIGDFIGQPVKTYSSGMYVRLAFACAINVDPEILIIDEALAVGDAKFQRKCYAKLEEFREKGKTVLFVSHGMDTINQICDSAMLLDKGQIIDIGVPKHITMLYHKMLFTEEVGPVRKVVINKEKETERKLQEEKQKQLLENKEQERIKQLASAKLKDANIQSHSGEMRFGNKEAEIIDFGIFDGNGERVTLVETGKKYTFFSRTLIYKDLDDIAIGFNIRTAKGLFLFGSATEHQKKLPSQKKGTILEARFQVTMWLGAGAKYFVTLAVRTNDRTVYYDTCLDAFHFEVSAGTINRNTGPSSLVDLDPHVSIRNINLNSSESLVSKGADV